MRRGQQLTKPAKPDGYMNLWSFLTFAFPVKLIKSNLNFNGGVTFNKFPGITSSLSNTSNNITYTFGTVLASNISQYVDFTLSYSGNVNNIRVQREQLSDTTDHYFQQVAGAQVNLLSKSGWFLQSDINNQLFRGLLQGYNQNYWLWNAAAGKKFLKDQKGELRLNVFDILRQNQSVTRNWEGM